MPSGFCPHNRAVDEMGNCFEQKFAPFWTATSVICWLFSLGAPGTRSKRCVSYILIHQGLPHFIWKNVLVVYVRVDPVSFYIFNMQPTRWRSVNNSVSLLTGASNTDLNKSWNYPKINHWPLNQRVFVPGVLWANMCWKRCSWCKMLCCSKNIPLPFKFSSPYWPITPFCTPASCSLTSPQMMVDS